MSTVDPKAVEVLRLVLDRTKKGAISWLAQGDVVTTRVGENRITIRNMAEFYNMAITNANGDLLTSVDSRAGVIPGHWIRELFELARRQTLKVDENLDSMINKLKG
ncbi:MAG TPA: hypothetical protein VFO29_08790 [Candidatus Rubrimentiphilum sp.]|nr:hypothetical protein [Candidatus Rubrimentiphilum sp.]